MASKKITFVDELDASKNYISMKVRIIQRWINALQRLDMVLVDEKGRKIQVVIKKDLVPHFTNKIKEDTAVLINGFGVGVSDDPFPDVKNKLKLSFYKSTQVFPDQPFSGHLYAFNFVSFDKITVALAQDDNTLMLMSLGKYLGVVIWNSSTQPKGKARSSILS